MCTYHVDEREQKESKSVCVSKGTISASTASGIRRERGKSITSLAAVTQ